MCVHGIKQWEANTGHHPSSTSNSAFIELHEHGMAWIFGDFECLDWSTKQEDSRHGLLDHVNKEIPVLSW